MRADRDYLLDVVTVECLNVLFSEYLIEVLVSHPTGRVSGAGLLIPQYGEVDLRPLEDRRHRAGDRLTSLFQRPGASDPEKYLSFGMIGQNLDVQSLGPVSAGVGRPSPRVASLLHAQEGILGGLRHAGLLHNHKAPHVHN